MGGLLSPFQVYTQQPCFCSPVTPTNLRHSRCRKEYIQQNGNGTKRAFASMQPEKPTELPLAPAVLGSSKQFRPDRPYCAPNWTSPPAEEASECCTKGRARASPCLLPRRSWCLPHARLLNTDRTYNGSMGTPKGL